MVTEIEYLTVDSIRPEKICVFLGRIVFFWEDREEVENNKCVRACLNFISSALERLERLERNIS